MPRDDRRKSDIWSSCSHLFRYTPHGSGCATRSRGAGSGKEIYIEDDVWVGGSVIILAGVRIGRGSTVGAGSVVTRDVPPFTFTAGNPAPVIRKIEFSMDPSQADGSSPSLRLD